MGEETIVLKDSIAGYRLRKPLTLTVLRDNSGIICLENSELELYGCGSSMDEAVRQLEMVLHVLIEEYAKGEDSLMHEKAKALKYRLLEYFEIPIPQNV